MTKQSFKNRMSDAKLLKKKITENLIFMKENISDIEKITDSLIEKGVIDILDRPKFLGDYKTPKDKIHGVLEEVITKRKYVEFFCALHDTGNDHVVQEIGNLNDKEFAEFTELQDWTSSSSATNAELFKEKGFTHQAFKSFVLNVEKKELQQEISQLQIEQKQLLSQLDVLKLNIKTLDSENKRFQTSNANIAKEKEILTIRVHQLEIKKHLLTQELNIKTEGINKIENQNIELLREIQMLKNQSKEDKRMHQKQREEDRNMHQKQREEDKKTSQQQREEDRNMHEKQREEDKKTSQQQREEDRNMHEKQREEDKNMHEKQREKDKEFLAQQMTNCKADIKEAMQTILNTTLDQREKTNRSNVLKNQHETRVNPDDATKTTFQKPKTPNTNGSRNKYVPKVKDNKTTKLRYMRNHVNKQ